MISEIVWKINIVKIKLNKVEIMNISNEKESGNKNFVCPSDRQLSLRAK